MVGLVELKHVGVVSAGKIYAILGALSGLLTGLSGGALLSAVLPISLGLEGITATIAFAVVGLVFGAVGGFVSGAVLAFIYNIIASIVGGVDVTFTKREAPGALPAQTAKTAAAAGAAAAKPVAKTSGVATAVNPELLNYLKGELAAGRPKEEVVAELVKAGWTDADIHAALNAAVLG